MSTLQEIDEQQKISSNVPSQSQLSKLYLGIVIAAAIVFLNVVSDEINTYAHEIEFTYSQVYVQG